MRWPRHSEHPVLQWIGSALLTAGRGLLVVVVFVAVFALWALAHSSPQAMSSAGLITVGGCVAVLAIVALLHPFGRDRGAWRVEQWASMNGYQVVDVVPLGREWPFPFAWTLSRLCFEVTAVDERSVEHIGTAKVARSFGIFGFLADPDDRVEVQWRSQRQLPPDRRGQHMPSGDQTVSEGWGRDPTGRHQERWFSAGAGTALVRDGTVEGHDPAGGITVPIAHHGWTADPTGRHQVRWFSAGVPTDLVRDGKNESIDPP